MSSCAAKLYPSPSRHHYREYSFSVLAVSSGQDFNSELRSRLSRINLQESNTGTHLSVSMSAQVFIDQYSSAAEVADWLQKKGFEPRYTTNQLLSVFPLIFTHTISS